jgi:gliding motility-associated-like protein
VQVVDDEGCVSIDSIFLRVYDDCLGSDFEIGKAFTPNYDGLNDRFEFRAETAAQIDWFRVWNRWGELVHDGNSPRGWDGRYRDRMMQPGVYVYAIQGRCINGEQFTRTGDVTLIR